MTSQGLRASPEGIRAAKTALTDKTLSQYKLATALGITRQPVSKFFAGEPVSRSCFVQICQQLDLSWQKVAGLSEDMTPETNQLQSHGVNLDTLMREVRQKRHDKIQEQCGTLQMLDIAQVVPLIDIYTPVNVWEEITSQQWLEISDLLTDFSAESNLSRLLPNRHQRKLSGLEVASRHSKLMVLGKPGSGKTIFLQYLAIACNQGEFQPQHIAIFIKLREFAEDSHECNLWKYISQEFMSCGVAETAIATILKEGKALILLDGLDEVPSDYVNKVTQELRRFTQYFYKNRFIINCRIAAQQYRFPGFTEVEVADFHYEQVEAFAKKWFVTLAHKSREDGEAVGNLFINQLNIPENHQIRELTITPILLHLICLVFQTKAKFPSNLAKLYEQLLNSFVVKWDAIRGIQRSQICENWTLVNKTKLLSDIAVITFARGNYFFEQEQIQEIITHYLSILVNKNIDIAQLDSQVLLNFIQSQDGLLVERSRGIYSFSHLTLHEYFAAKKIVEGYSEQTRKNLINHLNDQSWRRVFILTVSMLKNANEILELMKCKIDSLVADDQKIQAFLSWLHHKSSSVSTSYKPAAVRAFYLVCTRAFTQAPSYELECALVGDIAFNADLALDEFLTSVLTCANELDFAIDHTLNDALTMDHVHALRIAFDQVVEMALEPEFNQEIEKLKQQLPQIESNPHKLRYWWRTNGRTWVQKFKSMLIKHRNIGHDWQFNKQQIELLQKYYDTNKLLVDCLNQAVSLTPVLGQKIEETLLLAIADIQKSRFSVELSETFNLKTMQID